jgi:pimeloyl-ACP methyl ester carboxylesterase
VAAATGTRRASPCLARSAGVVRPKKQAKADQKIVFCHGIWADGSCFNKMIPTLQSEGYEVIAAQYGLDTLAGDVATVRRTLGRVSSPSILVGHSYGGSVTFAFGRSSGWGLQAAPRKTQLPRLTAGACAADLAMTNCVSGA